MAIKFAFVVGWFAVLDGILGMPGSAAELSIDLSATDAAKQWTGTFNPRPVSEKEFAEMYREVLADN